MKTKLLTKTQIESGLLAIPEWKRVRKTIIRKLVFADFREAVAFLVRIAFEAEEADHHPDITISYKRVTLSLSTHDSGGLTKKDFALAAKIEERFFSRGPRQL